MSYIRTYSNLIVFSDFVDRLEYLRLRSEVAFEKPDLYIRQAFYTSGEWKACRRSIILRDRGCDLGILDREIKKGEAIYVHHINPISVQDIIDRSDKLFDPENLITVTYGTHNIIHYGNRDIKLEIDVERKPNDTCPWRNIR